MRRYILNILMVLPLAAVLHSCSLLKFSADLGMKPLSGTELNTRVGVRMFATNFTDIVSMAADSLFVLSAVDSIRLASIKWKRNSTSAFMNASLNSIPEGAMVNTWVLIKGMNKMNWDEYFDKYAYVGEQTSLYLSGKYKKILSGYMNMAKMGTMERFVDSVVRAVPLDMQFRIKDYTYEWYKYSGVPDSLFVSTVGSISEVIADLNDRVGKYSVNAANQLEWGGELLEYKFGAVMADSTYKAGLDSLNNSLTMLKYAFRNAPEKVDSLIGDVNVRIDKLIGRIDYTMNSTLNNAFAQLAVERAALMEYVSKERGVIMAEGKVMIDDSIDKLLVSAANLIKNLLIYLVIFVLLLVGMPFYIGYKIGRGKTIKVLKQ